MSHARFNTTTNVTVERDEPVGAAASATADDASSQVEAPLRKHVIKRSPSLTFDYTHGVAPALKPVPSTSTPEPSQAAAPAAVPAAASPSPRHKKRSSLSGLFSITSRSSAGELTPEKRRQNLMDEQLRMLSGMSSSSPRASK
jgi:hypothetical protein